MSRPDSTPVVSGSPPSVAQAGRLTSNGPPASRAAPRDDPWATIAKRLEGFQPRPQQIKMATAVENAIESRRHLLVEAGTGTGKSFAYLVPALLHAHRNAKTVIVSTRTIALQDQLARDLPKLIGWLGLAGMTFHVAKGRSNYVCERRTLEAIQSERSRFDAGEHFPELLRIWAWAGRTEVGTRDELSFQPSMQAWEATQAERGNCLGKKCPFYVRCAYQEGQRRLKRARVIVANHSLVMADLALRMLAGHQYLPEHDVLILDEAHEVEDVATESFQSKLSEGKIRYRLKKLEKLIEDVGAHTRVRVLLSAARESIPRLFEPIKQQSRLFPERRITKPASFPDPLSPILEDLVEEMKRHGPKNRAQEWRKRRDDLAEIPEVLEAFLAVRDSEGWVYWVEPSRRQEPVLCRAPLHVDRMLSQALFARTDHPTVVLTSATLKVGKSFHHLAARLGVGEHEAIDVGSPFDFERQCELRTYPNLDPPTSKAYEKASLARIRDLVLESKGGAFVLFTSHSAVRKANEVLGAEFTERGLEVLVQGERPLPQIVAAFLERPNCVLFGTSTFWQGIDVPGHNLRLVVIAKLPFSVPNHPLRKAREDAVQARGGIPFLELSVPDAVIRVKQGFGRLIRRSDDTGVVAILDSRLHTKSYGRTFLESLPATARPQA